MQHYGFVTLLAVVAGAQAAQPTPVICTATAVYSGPAVRKAPAALPTHAIEFAKPMPKAVAEKLETRFREGLDFAKTQVGAIAIYRDDIGYWSSTQGIAPGTSKRFALASITKLATASVIFQLVDEKKLSLADTIDRWFPDLPNSRVITIDHLLSHTSGLMTLYRGANEARPDLAREFYWPSQEWKKWAGGNSICPGAALNYSNHGYVLLGRIAEQIDGAKFADIVDKRVAKPLGLKTFGIARPGIKVELVAAGESTDSISYDVKGKKHSVPYLSLMAEDPGAGAAFGEVGDMLVLLDGWLTGKLFSVANRDVALSRMLPINPSASFGRGIQMWEVPDSTTPATWLGHGGGMPGTSTIVIFDATRNAWFAAAINVRSSSLEAVANEMLKKLDEVAPRQSAKEK